MIRLFTLCVLAVAESLVLIAGLAQAAELRRVEYFPPAVEYSPPPEAFCPWCIRDAIYADTKLIAHLEANPDIDESEKGPIILGARAEVHYLRRILGPVHRITAGPCCYSRKPIYVR